LAGYGRDIIYTIGDFQPLDFSKTIDLLVSWEGRQVSVIANPQGPGAPLSHTQTVMAGVLGELQMMDNLIDEATDSVASFSVGTTPPNGFCLSPGDFRLTQPLPGRNAVRIDFEHNFSIQVDLSS
jgi:hypothetical protein